MGCVSKVHAREPQTEEDKTLLVECTEITENVDGWVHSPVVFILGMFEATNITVVKASQKCKVFHGQHI